MNTIKTTGYATQDRFVRVLMAICLATAAIGAVDLLRSL
jgi:hypothetical protein